MPRFAPEDFTDGDALGERFRWPIGYANLVEHYPPLERLLQIGGAGEDILNCPGGEVAVRVGIGADWSGVSKRAAERGHGLAALPLSYGSSWTLTRSGTPFNSYLRMLADIPRGPKFEVRFGARALRLEPSGGQSDRASHLPRRLRERAGAGASAVVIAAGCLNSRGSCWNPAGPTLRKAWATARGCSAATCTIIRSARSPSG